MNDLKYIWIGLLALSCTPGVHTQLIGQAGRGGDTIFLGNPSFEDIPRAGGSGFQLPIRGWHDCGKDLFPNETPPDIHPGDFWQVTYAAQHGQTYLGMVVRDNETWESVSQAFSAPLVAGQCYAFSVWLCRSDKYFSARSHTGDGVLFPFTRPAVMRIFGGRSLCHAGELLAESEPIVSHEWEQHLFRFEPVSNHRFITVQAFWRTPVLTPYNGHILVDNMSPIIRVPCGTDDLAPVFAPPVPAEQPLQPVNSRPPVSTPSPPPPPATRPAPPSAPEPSTAPEEAKLLAELDRSKIHTGKTIRIEHLFFKADSSRIQEDSYRVLDEIAGFLKNNSDVVIEIGGHTNTKPDHVYCNELSTERARAVKVYLLSRGVSSQQLTYKGYGKTKPLIPNDWHSRAAQAKNQRVEIKILSVG